MSTHLDRSPPAVAHSASTAAGSPSSRSRRLRGLSLLRSYTHTHLLQHSHHHPSSDGNGLRSNPTYSRSVTSPDLRAEAGSSQDSTTSPGLDGVQDDQQSSAGKHQVETQTTQEASPLNSSSSSGPAGGWLPTVGGRSGLSRVASQPQPSPIALPTAELAGVAPLSGAGANLTTSMGRRRTGSVPLGSRGTVPPHYTAAARDFARLDSGTNEANPSNVNSTPSNRPAPQLDAADPQLPLSEASGVNGLAHSQMPSIRFTPHQDPRSSRPSLGFSAVSRTLPSGSSVIRVGRYSEKDGPPNTNPNSPSASPIGFKSKVVSRRHCEFWCANGQWYIKDVKSSSGTFLNHIRLSTAGVESRPWPVNDGDVVQLGIDFKGGEEMIFRCVKIRVECNRGWQKGLNNFNTTTHKRLRNLATQKSKDSDTMSTNTSECSICLLSVAPCQALFVAPCSHVWHYKCIRPILISNMYPQFLCPNCRGVADLEAEVDEPSEDWESEGEEARKSLSGSAEELSPEPEQPLQTSLGQPAATEPTAVSNEGDIEGIISSMFRSHLASMPEQDSSQTPSLTDQQGVPENDGDDREDDGGASHESHVHSATAPVNIASRLGSSSRSAAEGSDDQDPANSATPSGRTASNTLGPLPDVNSPEGPMTPRNDAGPFVFDGRAGGAPSRQQSVHGSIQ
ncbi:MAG: hypothetical protein M4579_006350 [Chaenotheca gracillima]|nr:MAG: hypothetical protein M4579_006350 [Chaenotheca gracillima]